MQQCGMWYKCKMIKMWIQILAQMASLFNSCTHANSSGAFFITLSFGYCTLCLDIEYACIDLVQVSGWVCIDFFGRGEGPQYICTHVNLVCPEIIRLTSFLHPFRALLRCPASLRPFRNTFMISVLSSQDPYLLLRCMAVLLTVKISGCSCSSRATSGWTIPTCL